MNSTRCYDKKINKYIFLVFSFINLFKVHSIESKIIFSVNQKFIISYMPAFENLALALHAAFKDLGFNNIVMSRTINTNDKKSIYIIFYGAHILHKDLPKKYIIYQSEQIGSNWFNENYIKNLKKAMYVFDYSLTNIQYLKAKFNLHIEYLPFGFHPVLKKTPLCYSEKSYNSDQLRDIDVLFLGTLNYRRIKIKLELEKLDLNVVFKDYVPMGDLYELIKRSKIVLNLHFYEKMTILEISRLSLLWANRACVVTELSDDIYADNIYKDCALFSKYGDIAVNCKKLVDDLEKRIQISQNGHEIFTANHLLIDYIRKIIEIK